MQDVNIITANGTTRKNEEQVNSVTGRVAELNSVMEHVNSVPTKVTKCSYGEDIKSVTVEYGECKCTVKNELMQEVIGSIEFLDQNNPKLHPVVKLYR